MDAMRALARRLLKGAEILLALMLASMFVCFLVQIVFRYVLNLPVGWTDGSVWSVLRTCVD